MKFLILSLLFLLLGSGRLFSQFTHNDSLKNSINPDSVYVDVDIQAEHPKGKEARIRFIEKNIDAAAIQSNHFEMEWPPRSGKYQSFPEVDKGGWFTIEEAKKKINVMQAALIEELELKSAT